MWQCNNFVFIGKCIDYQISMQTKQLSNLKLCNQILQLSTCYAIHVEITILYFDLYSKYSYYLINIIYCYAKM